MTDYPAICTCCRKRMANTFFTVLTARGINVHICTACGPHISLRHDGAVEFPVPCPLAERQTTLRLVE